MKTFFNVLVAVLCAFVFSSCSTARGPLYHDVKGSLTPQPGKALAILYFKPGGAGAGNKFPIYANHQVLTEKFQLGGFYTYQASPGPLILSVSAAGDNQASAGQGAVNGIILGPIGVVTGGDWRGVYRTS